MKDGMIDILDKNKFIVLQDEEVPENKAGVLGVYTNKIVEIPNFIDPEIVPKMIHFFENCNVDWGDIAFYGSSGKGILTDSETMKKFELPDEFFDKLKNKYQETVQLVFGREVRANTSHAQKWDAGGFASPHSDNSDNEGKPNAFEINKYVGILYLNDDFEGGLLKFPSQNIEIKPEVGMLAVFDGGFNNMHEVSLIESGVRYTIGSFWDDREESDYPQELRDQWAIELQKVRDAQAVEQKEWNEIREKGLRQTPKSELYPAHEVEDINE